VTSVTFQEKKTTPSSDRCWLRIEAGEKSRLLQDFILYYEEQKRPAGVALFESADRQVFIMCVPSGLLPAAKEALSIAHQVAGADVSDFGDLAYVWGDLNALDRPDRPFQRG